MPTADNAHAFNVRRWISEFVVIVAGVTAALAADSLWDRWQNARSERAYIQQLQSDLAENASRLNSAIQLEAQQKEAASAAYNAVASGQVITQDSAVAWLITRRGISYSDPRLLMGTVTALISTGDLGLLPDSHLRQAVAAYATQIEEDRVEFNRFVQALQPPFEALRQQAFLHDKKIDTHIQYGPVVAAITGRPGRDALMALDGVIVASQIRMIYLQRMLKTNDELRALLDVKTPAT